MSQLDRASLMVLVSTAVLGAGASLGFDVAEPSSALRARAFVKEDLRIPTSNVALASLADRVPNGSEWARFLARNGADLDVHIDPRTGTPSRVSGHIPMIPGSGADNRVTLPDLELLLGRRVPQVTAEVLEDLVARFVIENQGAFGIDPGQLGPARAVNVTPYLWHVFLDQRVDGIPVRHARAVATLNHGNLVIFGTEAWATVRTATTPRLTAADARSVALAYAGGAGPGDMLWKEPELELVPYDRSPGQPAAGVGLGYGHRLAWVLGIRRSTEVGKWEVVVDAASGEILSFEDTNQYGDAQITGGVYPITSTGTCPSGEHCGVMQSGYPMPYADTGLAAPNDVTDSAGHFDHTGGTARTHLSGPYLSIFDSCGAINESGGGSIAMGGSNNQHDCQVSGTSAGNTPASRTAFYELMKLKEQAAGWLPSNGWINGQLPCNVNIASTCNAFWNGSSINFYRSGNGCRNTGELAGVFDHEWGHGLDAFDGGPMSNSSEAYADIAAMYRLQTSCMGYGFFQSKSYGCGRTSDGTGDNHNEAQVGPAHCATNCSGVREADWNRHADHQPDTPANFVCSRCNSGSGPCGREVHCAAAPVNQAAWDLATRDLQAAPYNYDSNMAFIVANKLFYHGSAAISLWHSCDCSSGTSDGCGSMSGYMQWLAADDDNGNISDGTPHMTAIHAAFNRHKIACGSPTPTRAGCAAGPATAPTLAVEPGNGRAVLSWNAVPSGQFYWVFRTEGVAGCDFGKALIAWVAGLSYEDTQVANGRQYCYTVVPATGDFSCFGLASNCACVTPATTARARYVVGSARQLADTGDDDGWPDNCERVTAQLDVTNDGSGTASNVEVTSIASSAPAVSILTPLPITVGSLAAGATKTVTFEYGVTGASCMEVLPFTVAVTASQMSQPSTGAFNVTAEVDATPVAPRMWSFESDLEGWSVASGTFVRFQPAGSAHGNWALVSSQYQPNRCDIIRSPVFVPTASTTLDVSISFDINPCVNGWCHDRANIGVWDGSVDNVVYATTNGYNAWGYGGTCGTENHYGWSGQYGYQWYDSSGYDLTPWAGTPVSLDVRYGAGTAAGGYGGFAFDWVRLNDVSLVTCDAQPDGCAPPPVPDGLSGTPVTARKSAGTAIAVSWDPSCAAASTNIIFGDLASVAGYGISGADCAIGSTGTHTWSAPSGDLFFLVVGASDLAIESSWGQTSGGVERNGTTPSQQCGVVRKDPTGVCAPTP